jgi:Damage-control phosphatase ARMT1-like domain
MSSANQLAIELSLGRRTNWLLTCFPAGMPTSPFRRAIIFVDNAGADIVLGMLPLARELLRCGSEVHKLCNHPPSPSVQAKL